MRQIAPVQIASVVAAILSLTGCIQMSHSRSEFDVSTFTATTNLTHTGTIPEGLTGLDIENQFGNVRIAAAQDGDATWSWRLSVSARSDAIAQEVAETARCIVEPAGKSLRIALSMPERPGQYNYRSDFELRVPPAFVVNCRNRHGAVRVADIGGDLDVVNAHGPVDVRSVKGAVRVQTSYAGLSVRDTGPATLKAKHGRLSAEQVHGRLVAETSYAALKAADVTGAAQLRNQHGAIELTGAGGNVDAQTSYARLVIQGVRGDALLVNQHGRVEVSDVDGSVDARTSYASLEVAAAGPALSCINQHGAVRVRARSPMLTTLSAETSYAPLDVRLPAAAKPHLRARTTHGEVDSDFPVILKSGDSAATTADPGAPRVTLENRHGAIRVAREH